MLAAGTALLITARNAYSDESLNDHTLSKESIAAKAAAIRTLDTESNKDQAENEKNFDLLLTSLNDENAECRIAAAEALGKTSRESAVTHMIHRLQFETNEKVICEIKKAIAGIRENIHREYAENT